MSSDGGNFISRFFDQLDKEMEDFMFKRLGNGEQFYGRRATRGEGEREDIEPYKGFGLSDRRIIDNVREVKEERDRRRRERETMERGE